MNILLMIGWAVMVIVIGTFALLGAFYVLVVVSCVVGLVLTSFCEIVVDFWRWIRNPRRHWL